MLDRLRPIARAVIGGGVVIVLAADLTVVYARVAGAGDMPVGHVIHVDSDAGGRLVAATAIVDLGLAEDVRVVVGATATCVPRTVLKFSIHSSSQFRYDGHWQHTTLLSSACGRGGRASAEGALYFRKSDIIGRLGPAREAFDLSLAPPSWTSSKVVVDLGLSARFETTYAADDVGPDVATWRDRGPTRVAGITIAPEVAVNVQVLENVFLVVIGAIVGWIGLPQPSRRRGG